MRVRLSKYAGVGDSAYDVHDRVTCQLGGAEVEVRQIDDAEGEHLVVVIKNGPDNKVQMESRAAAIWLEVDPRVR